MNKQCRTAPACWCAPQPCHADVPADLVEHPS
ncbi:hypothetical protein ACH4HG_34115 [Streptomyces coeruleorubidus]